MPKAGRPSVKTEEVIRKIKEVAALDGTIEEMAYYSEVHVGTIYRWMEEDPELKESIQALRQRPILAARQTVIKRMNESYGNAMDYLSRKKQKEFNKAQNIDITSGGQVLGKEEDQGAVDEFHNKLVENRKKRALEQAAIEGELVEGVAEDESPGVQEEEILQEGSPNNAQPTKEIKAR